MKLTLAMILIAVSAVAASAQYNPYGSTTYGGSSGLNGTGSNPSNHYVSPYTNSHGTNVQGHYQTNPNSTQTDNYGATGNVNPYTGAIGTHRPRY